MSTKSDEIWIDLKTVKMEKEEGQVGTEKEPITDKVSMEDKRKLRTAILTELIRKKKEDQLVRKL